MHEEIREKKEMRNNIMIKGWEVAQRDLLKKAVEEMIKREIHTDATVIEAFWTRRSNMITAKLKDKEQKRMVMIKKNSLKEKN